MRRFTRLPSRKGQRPRPALRPEIEALEERALLANIQWSGLGADNLWFTEDNWINRDTATVQRPVNGDNLFFPSDAARRLNFNNFPVTLQVNAISFTADGPLTGAGYNLGGAQIQLGAGGITHSVARGNTISLDMAMPATRTFSVTAGTLDARGALSGAGGVTKTGTGTLEYSGATANSYAGATTVNAGLLELNKSAGITAVPALLAIGDSAGGASADVVRLLRPNQIANAATVTVTSSGLLDLNSQDENVTQLTMTSGSVTIGASGTLTLLANVATSAAAAGATISGGRLFMAAASLTFTVSDGTTADDLSISAVVSSFGGRALTKAGAGRLVLSRANDFSGTMTVSAGILSVRSTSALGQPGAGTTVVSGATLEVQIQGGVTVAEPLTLNGTGVGNLGALLHINTPTQPPALPFDVTWTGPITLNSTSGIGSVFAFSGFNRLELQGAIGGVAGAGLTKLGPGLLRLRGANTYTGATTVSVGTLLIDGAQPNSPVTVNNGAILGGTGTVGALTANAGATVSPGTIGVGAGALTVQGNVTLNAGSTLLVTLNAAPAASDRLRLVGPGNRTVTINNATLDARISFAASGGSAFTVIDNTTSGAAPVGTFNSIPQGGLFTATGVSGAADQAFRMNYTGGDFNDAVITRNTAPRVEYILMYPDLIAAGDYSYLVGQLTDPDPDDFQYLIIFWGDGSEYQIEYPGLEPFVYYHQYTTPGDYYVVPIWVDLAGEYNFQVLPLTVLPSGAPSSTGGQSAAADVAGALAGIRAATPHANYPAAPAAIPSQPATSRETGRPALSEETAGYAYAARNSLSGAADLDAFFAKPSLGASDWDSLDGVFSQIS